MVGTFETNDRVITAPTVFTYGVGCQNEASVYSEKAWACDLNGIAQGGTLMGEYALVIMYFKFSLPAAGFVRRLLLWCFESRARAAVARAAIFTKLHNSWAMFRSIEKWNHERLPGRSCDFCVNMASKQVTIQFFSHISSIFSTPRCRAQTYTPNTRYITCMKQAGWYGLFGFEF